jgi:hypothetical protein
LTTARLLILAIAALVALPVIAQDDADTPSDPPSPWGFQLYFDGGYGASSTEPENETWRNKSTTFKIDSLQLNLAMAQVRREPSARSRWGMEFGLQTGVDSEGLVTSAPPPADEPVSKADTLRYLYRANFSWLFSARRGIRVTAGLINSYIGYESYVAIDNPNYTRGYIADTVPFFLWGIETAYSPSDAVDLGFYVVTGWNYLTSPNSHPSFGLNVGWRISPRVQLKQNLYIGPDQAETGLEYWRVLSDTSVEWSTERFLLAAAIDLGTERQARLPGTPRADWMSGALWARWLLGEHWRIAVRPEFFHDDEGRATGAEQRLHAITATLQYEILPVRDNRLVATLEARADRSTGEGGGFYSGPFNDLVSGKNLVLVALLWSFDRGSR